MKLLIGCSSPPDDGAGILSYVKELSQQLLLSNNEVHLVSPTPRDNSWLIKNNIKHIASDQDDNPIEVARYLLDYVYDNQIDGVINNDNSFLHSIAPGLACPFIAIGHLSRTSIATLACYRWQWSDYVVAISNDMQQRFVTRFRVPLAKCPIIHNGIADTGHDGDFSRKDPNKLRVIFVGGYNRRLKGADLVHEAALSDREQWQGIQLVWYGSIPQKMALRLADLPYVCVQGQVSREELFNALSRADVLLFPSRTEGCPMAMLEAMSHGLAIIASDGEGAMRWLITSGQEGYICCLAHWPAQMLECLKYLRDNSSTLIDMKRASRNRFLAEFQSSSMTEKLLKLISRPTVDRSSPPKKINILHWRTPMRADGKKARFFDRIWIRIGVLRNAGTFKTSTAKQFRNGTTYKV